jgi:hypothetical protein
MLRDRVQAANSSIDEWVNLTPTEMLDCYTKIKTSYRRQRDERPELPDLEHRVKIMYDSMVDGDTVLFYFCQRYPRIFHNLTSRTVPKWFRDDFLFHFFQTQLFVEQGIMTMEQRLESIDETFTRLNPGDDSWQREESDYKSYLLKPSRMQLTPEL